MGRIPKLPALQRDASTVTAADLLVESLYHYGVDYIFANFGTDHVGIIESLARHAEAGISSVPKVVQAQHEMIAISSALAYAQLTGRPQAVVVHVDVGTANLGAGVHSASRGRIPVLLFAGKTPLTAHNELPGGRNRPVHFHQDVYDQAGNVREYVKWEYELRVPHNVVEVVARALQMATSPPGGPVYLTAAREILEMPVPESFVVPSLQVLEQGVPDQETLSWVTEKLHAAKRPVLITTHLGEDPEAVGALVRFAERFGVGIIESGPRYVNFPTDNELHLGFNPNVLVHEADLVLVVGCDVPWIPSEASLSHDATVVWVDREPLQSHYPFHPFPATRILQANPRLFLQHLTDGPGDQSHSGEFAERAEWARAIHRRQRDEWRNRADTDDRLTAASLGKIVAEETQDDTVFVDDAVSNKPHVLQQIPRVRSGQYIAGHGLGWGMGAALGAKLARPESDVVALVGDGSYVFGVPTGVHWAQRAYDAPFLTVIFNNGGWKAVDNAVRAVHAGGAAIRSGQTHSFFSNPAELSRVVSTVDGQGFRVESVSQAREAIRRGLDLIRDGIPVVIDARVER